MWSKFFKPLFNYSPYCFGAGIVIYEKDKWESMSFLELYGYLTRTFHVTANQFSSKSEMMDFYSNYGGCVHKDKQQQQMQESVVSETEWINKYIQYGHSKDGDKFIENCQNITQNQNNLKQEYALHPSNDIAISIDDSYWNIYELFRIPNSSMSCSQNIVFVLFNVLQDVLKDILNDQKYGKLINNSFIEMHQNQSKYSDNIKYNILDIGCGVGLIGESLSHFYQYFSQFRTYFGDHDSFNDLFNLYGFDHSINALNYGKNKYEKYSEKYNKIFLGDLTDDNFIRNTINKQTADGLYDIVIASDVLFQEPINGILGIESIKKAVNLVKPGGFLVVGSPIQNSSPCLNDSYNKVLKPFFEENDMYCILYDEIVKSEIEIGLDEVYIVVKMYFKQPK